MPEDNEDTVSATNNMNDGQEVMSNPEEPEVSQEPSVESKQIIITINRAWAKVAAFILAGFLGFIAGAFVTSFGLDDEHGGGRHHYGPGGHSRMYHDDDRFDGYGPGGMMPGYGMDLRDCPDDMPMMPGCRNQNDSPVNPEDSPESPTPTN